MQTDEARRAPSRLVLSLLIVLAVVLVFGQAIGFDFISFDDIQYVTENPHVRQGLTWANVRWAMGATDASVWLPLTWITHCLDVSLWGVTPAGPHVENVLLHASSSVLLFVTLDRATRARWRSFIATLLFAVHPLRADSVAWIAERKDVLSTFFLMLTLLAYVAYAERPSAARFARAVLAFAAATLSKASAVPFPIALVLFDFWPLGRFGKVPLRRLAIEMVPFGLLSIACSALTYRAHEQGIVRLPLAARLEDAAVSYGRFIAKTFWPSHLSIYYPHPSAGGAPLTALEVTAGALVIVLLALLAVLARRRPYVPFGIAWFLLLLLPLSGVVQSGLGATADRFSYVPSIGLAIAVVWAVADVLSAWSVRAAVAGALAGAAVATYGALGAAEVAHYKDSVSVFTHALESTGPNWMADQHLGYAAMNAGRTGEAVAHWQRALESLPNDAWVLTALGEAYVKTGRSDEAVHLFRRSLAVVRRDVKTRFDLCETLLALDRRSEAVPCLRHLADLYDAAGRGDLASDARREEGALLSHP